MKICHTCRHAAADSTLISCVDCGVLLHPECALARLCFVSHRPTARNVCDDCFTKWMLTVPTLLRGVALAEVSHLASESQSS